MKRMYGFAAMTALLLFSGCAVVDEGHEGYEWPAWSAVQVDQIVGVGTHWGYVFDDLLVVDMRERVTKYEGLNVRMASVRLFLKVNMAVSWKVKRGKGGYVHRELQGGVSGLPNKLKTLDQSALKAVIGADTTLTFDDVFNQQETLEQKILDILTVEYDKVHCEPTGVKLTDFDLPDEIDRANEATEKLKEELKQEKTQLAMAEVRKQRRATEAEAAAAFQNKVGKIDNNTIKILTLENQKLWIETIRAIGEKNNVNLNFSEMPVMLNFNPKSN